MPAIFPGGFTETAVIITMARLRAAYICSFVKPFFLAIFLTTFVVFSPRLPPATTSRPSSSTSSTVSRTIVVVVVAAYASYRLSLLAVFTIDCCFDAELVAAAASTTTPRGRGVGLANSALVHSRRLANSPLNEMCECSTSPLRISARAPLSTNTSCSRTFRVASASKHPINFRTFSPFGSADLGRDSASLMKSSAPAETILSCWSSPPMLAMAHSACAAAPTTSMSPTTGARDKALFAAGARHSRTATTTVLGRSLNLCCFRSLAIVLGLLAMPRNTSNAATAHVRSPGYSFRHSTPQRTPPSIITMYAESPFARFARALNAPNAIASCLFFDNVGGGFTANIASIMTLRLRAAYSSFASKPRAVTVPARKSFLLSFDETPPVVDASRSTRDSERSTPRMEDCFVTIRVVSAVSVSLYSVDVFSRVKSLAWANAAPAWLALFAFVLANALLNAAASASETSEILTTFRASSHSSARTVSLTRTASNAFSASP
mmetsp:Transcript_15268/g.65389  ORF Transcript_15268/g.65389 Transcript_15268/m.65389 type:complete len:493 (+) Transcript_15268:1733-3211(+)